MSKKYIAAVAAVLIAAAVILTVIFIKSGGDKTEKPTVQSETSETASSDEIDIESITDAELKKLAESGIVRQKIEQPSSEKMQKMLGQLSELEFADVSEQEFSDRVYEYTGCQLRTDNGSLTESAADTDDFYYADAGDGETESYLVFDKSEKNMYIVKITDSEHLYADCERVPNDKIAERFEKESDNTEILFTVIESGETVMCGVTSGDWMFYYNDNGELFVCCHADGNSFDRFYNYIFEEISSDQYNMITGTVIENINSTYGIKLFGDTES